MLGGLALVVLLGGAAVWWQVGRSLPLRDGVVVLTGLAADVTIERDALGVPTIRAGSQTDAAAALGFLHAQERFFQMDLARRRAAGELSELFGRAAIPTDRAARLHRFRARATRVLAASVPEHRAVVDAYTHGVNAGLAALGAAPFEYLLLRQAPRAWSAEDSILVVASMFFTLQDAAAIGDARAGALHEALPAPLAAFLNSTASEWDSPEVGAPLPPPVPPGPEVFDLRSVPPAAAVTAPTRPAVGGLEAMLAAIAAPPDLEGNGRGSNNWAVAGSHTVDGQAILADDMHLGLGVPNIWYRASVIRPHDGGEVRITGATLPGVPGTIVGSNGHIAWGFTNTTADWSDRVELELDDAAARYRTPDGWLPFEESEELIAVDGDESERLVVRETIWGPVTGPDGSGRLHAIVWVAHSPEGMNLRLIDLETAGTLEDAMTIANLSGTPAQNCTLADANGRIAWTVAGRVPRRVGFDGTRPTSWADGTRRWDGWYAPGEYPRILDPDDGVIVTANNRIVSGTHLTMLGDGGYDPGARARRIKDGLDARMPVDYADILAVHLDDRSELMTRWRGLALDVLARGPRTAGRDQFRHFIENDWTGRATIDSVGYRLIRDFRQRAATMTWAPFTERVRAIDAGFPSTPGRSLEGPVWALLTGQPGHLLNPRFTDWDGLMLEAIDQVVATLTADGRPLADRTWGEINTLRAQHPLSRAVPQLSRWLDLPSDPLPGDSHVPRFQSATNGASERFAVSPGHEQDGYFHMPGGQSGHPRSPNFMDGHRAWVDGTPTPFLPGPTVATLVLRPQPDAQAP